MGISYQLDSGAELLAKMTVPYKGMWTSVPSHMIPSDALFNGHNGVIYQGKFVSRPGLQQFDSFSFPSEVLGSYLHITKAGLRIPLAVTGTGFYTYQNGWSERTGAQAFSVAPNARVRMTSLVVGDTFYTVIANGQNGLFSYIGGNIIPIDVNFGKIPGPVTDVATSFGRIVGISPPYTVFWSEIYSINRYPELNQGFLMDTPDALVSVKALGTLGLVFYKEGSITLALGQAGSEAGAFSFEFRGKYEGPCNPASVVDVHGIHYGLTPSGRVFRFDGSSYDYIADGIWYTIRANLDRTRKHLVHGSYNYNTNHVTFWYPKIGQTGVTEMLTICLPLPKAGITDHACFTGTAAFSCTESLGNAFFQQNNETFVFGGSATGYKTYIYSPNFKYDGQTEILTTLQSGLVSSTPVDSPKQSVGQIFKPSFELYVNRAEGKKNLSFTSMLSNNLEIDAGSPEESEEIDMSAVRPNEFIGFTENTSFVGFKIEANASSGLEYLGCDIFGRKNS